MMNGINYECPSCQKTFDKLDRHYFAHITDCIKKILKQKNDKIEQERNIRRQLSLQHTIVIDDLKNMFDKNLNIIKQHYEDALKKDPTNSQNLNTILQEQQKVSDNNYKKIIEELHQDYTTKLVQQQRESEKSIKNLQQEYLEKEFHLQSRSNEIITELERITMLKDMYEKGENNKIIEIQNMETKYNNIIQENLQQYRNKLYVLQTKNNKLLEKLRELMIANTNYHDKIINNNQEIKTIELQYKKEFNKIQQQFTKYYEQFITEKQQLEDTITDLNTDIKNKFNDNNIIKQELDELNKKYELAQRNIRDWNKKYNKLKQKYEKKTSMIRKN